jgi:hypothetical protein
MAVYNKSMEPYASIVKNQIDQILEKEPNAVLIEDNIVVLKNWLSDDLCDKLVSHVESFGEDIWWDRNKREWWHGKFFFIEDPELDEELKHMRIRLQELFRQELWVESMNSVHRMTKGQSMFLHADNLSESLGMDNKCVFGVTHYLSNFDGGEISYPNVKFMYKPEKGDFLLHPGFEKYAHYTEEVKGDRVRYIVAGFASLPEAQALRENDQLYEGINAIKMSSAITGEYGENDLPKNFYTLPFEHSEKK